MIVSCTSPVQYAAKLAKGTHVLLEGELAHREYNRTIETESASVKVQWPFVEIVVESLKVLDRKKEKTIVPKSLAPIV